MKKYILFSFLLILLFCSSLVNATQISFSSVNVTGSYHNSLNFLTDDIIPGESGQWQNNTVWWNGTGTAFTFDMGSSYTLEDIILSVDNNDYYRVEYSSDNSVWNTLFSISRYDGEIGWGMDTMATSSTHSEYIPAIDFSPVNAQYLRIQATGGDNSYSIGEFQAFGEIQSNPVPEPATMFLLGSGLAGLAGFRKKFRKK